MSKALLRRTQLLAGIGLGHFVDPNDVLSVDVVRLPVDVVNRCNLLAADLGGDRAEISALAWHADRDSVDELDVEHALSVRGRRP
jgi:hypothetical protein